MQRTNRGFNTGDEWIDTRQNRITVRESSAACEHCTWIFIKNDGKIGDDFKGDMSLHLNQEQAIRLINEIGKVFGFKEIQKKK